MKQKSTCLRWHLEVGGGVLLKDRFVRRHLPLRYLVDEKAQILYTASHPIQAKSPRFRHPVGCAGGLRRQMA